MKMIHRHAIVDVKTFVANAAGLATVLGISALAYATEPISPSVQNPIVPEAVLTEPVTSTCEWMPQTVHGQYCYAVS